MEYQHFSEILSKHAPMKNFWSKPKEVINKDLYQVITKRYRLKKKFPHDIAENVLKRIQKATNCIFISC